MQTEIVILSGEWPDQPPLCTRLRQAVDQTISRLGMKSGKTALLSIALSDNEHVHALNLEFRQADKPTNVLSFSGGENEEIDSDKNIPDGLLGDIILASGVVAAEAQRDGKSLSDHAVHLTIHGLLHLLGYTHENECDAETMETLEVEILRTMNIADPYDAGPGNPACREQPELT